MAANLIDSLLEARSDFATRPDSTGGARSEAVRALRANGLPGARNETWKYTALRALNQRTFVDGDPQAAARLVDATLFALPGADGNRIVFVNGVYRGDLSLTCVQAGFSVSTIADSNTVDGDYLKDALARQYSSDDAFAQLNTALVVDGPVLRVAPGIRVDAPVHVVFVGVPADQDVAWQSRMVVEIGAGASLQLIEHHIGAGSNAHLGNLVAQYALRADSTLDLVQMQSADAASTLIRRSEFVLERDAALQMHSVEVGALLMRHDVEVTLDGPRARLSARGVFALGGRQHCDTHLSVTHRARDTTSDILWRGIADQRARGILYGAITVAPGADGSDAKLSSKNMLLSAHAEIDAQPVLEIHADEVKAAHGATVGQLDLTALFYLRSRGISMPDARALLISAFSAEALSDIGNENLRAALAERVALQLGAA